MSENFDDQNLDDELADFTDRLLSGKGLAEPEFSFEDEELQKLQKIVVELKHTRDALLPGEAYHQRLHAALMEEWRLIEQTTQPTQTPRYKNWGNWLKNIWDLPRPRGITLSLAAAATFLLLVALLVPPLTGGSLKGAAGLNSALPPYIFILALVCGLVIFWLLRHPKE